MTDSTTPTWKQYLLKAMPYLAMLVIGVGIGWWAKPDVVRIEEKIKTIEIEKQVVVTQEKVRVEVVKVKDVQVVERWHREKTEEKRPDGTVITKEVEDRNIDSKMVEKENNVQVKVVEVEKQVIVEREKQVERKIEPVLPQWHLGVLAGVAPRFDVPTETSAIVGVEAERRIVGPIWLGAWGMTGIPVVGAVHLTNTALGIKVGLEF